MYNIYSVWQEGSSSQYVNFQVLPLSDIRKCVFSRNFQRILKLLLSKDFLSVNIIEFLYPIDWNRYEYNQKHFTNLFKNSWTHV